MKFIKPTGFLIAMLACLQGLGQDILFMRDGSRDSVKVQEITPVEIVFKKFKRPQGPIYRINKFEVILIEFEDGTVEEIGDPPPKVEVVDEATRKKEEFIKKLGPNIISLNYMSLFVGNLYVGYERIFADGIIGLKGTVNYHIKSINTDILGYDRIFTAGADLNFYPTRQGKVKYFLGPGLRIGQWGDNFLFFGSPGPQKYTALSFYINNGFVVQPTPEFYMGFQGGLGVGFLRGNGTDRNFFSEPDGVFAFSLGYRF